MVLFLRCFIVCFAFLIFLSLSYSFFKAISYEISKKKNKGAQVNER